MVDFGLGRRQVLDERDAAFPFRMAMAELPVRRIPVAKTWITGRPILNQGLLPQCVAYAWKQWLMASPIKQGRTIDTQEVYEQSQAIDEFPDTPPAGGTSVRAGAKVMQMKGYISTYLWATTIDEIREWILRHGPVVVGTNWYEAMFEGLRETHSILHGFWVKPEGAVVGGHAWNIIGYSLKRHAFRGFNSWGPNWGEKGKFWIAEEHMAQLMAEQGEAVTALETRV